MERQEWREEQALAFKIQDLPFSIIPGGHLCLQSLSTGSSESDTEVMFLRIDEGLQSFLGNVIMVLFYFIIFLI